VVGLAVVRLQLDCMILEVFSSLNDSMILLLCEAVHTIVLAVHMYC